MRLPLALSAILVLTIAAPAHAGKARPLDAASLERFARETLQGFDRLELVAPTLDEDLVLFVADDAGTPLALRGPAGGADFRARLAAWKADGWLLDTEITDLSCRTAQGLGVCTARYHQRYTVKGEPAGDGRIRATLVAAARDGRWHLVHLHESPDAAPTAPAQPETAE